jgi:hypothetical protein
MITNTKLNIKTENELGNLKFEGFVKNYSIIYIIKKDPKTKFKVSL